jgi:hypothetical protein
LRNPINCVYSYLMPTPFLSSPFKSAYREALRPDLARNDSVPIPVLPRGGKGWPHQDVTVETVRRLIEETTLTYHQIAARTGTSPASISRWMQAGEWKRPLFAPRSMSTVPTPRATAYLKRRMLAKRLAALADRYVRELEETPAIDLDKLGQALELWKMARLAAMSRTARRTEAVVSGELMRPIVELCAVGVELSRAPREAVEDFLENRATPPDKERPPRSRGLGNARYFTRAQRHAWMLEKE